MQRTLELVCDKDGLVFLRGSSLTAQLRGKFKQASEGGTTMHKGALRVLVDKFPEFPWTTLLEGSPDVPEAQTTPNSFSEQLDQIFEALGGAWGAGLIHSRELSTLVKMLQQIEGVTTSIASPHSGVNNEMF